MLDDLRTYLQMAGGITEATTTKAREVVTGLLTTGLSLTSKAMPSGDMVGQVQELADDLVATSRNNREMLVGLIRSEVDRAVGRMGFVREDELAALRKHVQRLEKDLADLAAACAEEAQAAAVADEDATVIGETVVVVDEPSDAPVKKRKKILLEDAGGSDA